MELPGGAGRFPLLGVWRLRGGLVLRAGPAGGLGRDGRERSVSFRAPASACAFLMGPFSFLCRDGQVHETREGGAGPGWTVLLTQSSHREEY